MQLPRARTEDLVEQEADNELLVYDQQAMKAYNLNETSKNVFKACNGATSFGELKLRHEYSDDVIYLALDELRKKDLIDSGYDSPFAGMTRREVVRKVGLASMIALPVISTLVAPTAANAASTCTADNPTGSEEGSGGTCYCPRSTGNNSTCGTGAAIGTTPRVTTNCKTGCTCRRTQATSSMNQPCSAPASPILILNPAPESASKQRH